LHIKHKLAVNNRGSFYDVMNRQWDKLLADYEH
jgi:hypothetical protein